MAQDVFFKPTPVYKEYMLLDLIEKDHKITQRTLSETLGVATSMINQYIDDFESRGLLIRKYISQKYVEYHITKKGIERKKVLNIGYLRSTQHLYNTAKSNIEAFLNRVKDKGFNKIILYGAGEVAEIMISTINSDNLINIEAVAIIDDDMYKIGSDLLGVKIISLADIEHIAHDGVLISSFTNRKTIKDQLQKANYPKDKTIEYFD